MSSTVEKYQTLKTAVANAGLSEDEVILLLGNLLLEHSSTHISVLDKTLLEIDVNPSILEDYSKLFIEAEYYPDSFTYALATLAHNLIAFSNEVKALRTGAYGT